MIWTKAFWKGAAERAIKTFFQSGIMLVPTTVALLQEVNWTAVVSGATLAAVLSLATSVGNADFTSGEAAGKHVE